MTREGTTLWEHPAIRLALKLSKILGGQSVGPHLSLLQEKEAEPAVPSDQARHGAFQHLGHSARHTLQKECEKQSHSAPWPPLNQIKRTLTSRVADLGQARHPRFGWTAPGRPLNTEDAVFHRRWFALLGRHQTRLAGSSSVIGRQIVNLGSARSPALWLSGIVYADYEPKPLVTMIRGGAASLVQPARRTDQTGKWVWDRRHVEHPHWVRRYPAP